MEHRAASQVQGSDLAVIGTTPPDRTTEAMVRIDREVQIVDQDLACLEVHRFGVEGRTDDVEGARGIRKRAIGGRLRIHDLGI